MSTITADAWLQAAATISVALLALMAAAARRWASRLEQKIDDYTVSTAHGFDTVHDRIDDVDSKADDALIGVAAIQGHLGLVPVPRAVRADRRRISPPPTQPR